MQKAIHATFHYETSILFLIKKPIPEFVNLNLRHSLCYKCHKVKKTTVTSNISGQHNLRSDTAQH
jgi:hypothetical protein